MKQYREFCYMKKYSTSSPNILTIKYLRALSLLFAGLFLASAIPSHAQVIEKSKRFNSIMINGQMKDNYYFLRKLAGRVSKGRLLLILFGDPEDKTVQDFKVKATNMLKSLSGTGEETALLHIDTQFYKEAPARIFFENNPNDFKEPSVLLYVDVLQTTYHTDLSDYGVRRMESHLVIFGHEFMGWMNRGETETQPKQQELKALIGSSK